MKRKARFAAAALACLLIAPACGKKGGILAPLTLVPQKVETLKAAQRGGLVLLEWTNPTAYIDGRALDEISEIEIWLEERPDPPAPAPGAKPPVKPPAPPPAAGDFAARAKRLAVLSVAAKPAPRSARNPKDKKPAASSTAPKAPPNASYVYRLDPARWAGRTFAFALRVRDTKKKRLSDFSSEVAFKPKALAVPPAGVGAAVFADRIEIRWTAPSKNFDGTAPPLVKGYNIYRSDITASPDGTLAVSSPRRLDAAPVAGVVFADKEFSFGLAYRYFVRAAGAEAEPFLESEDSEVVDVRPLDIFPPAVPAGLSAVTGPDFVTLVWDAAGDRDLAGYHVWRRVAGAGAYVRLTTAPVPEPTFTDRAVEKNGTYEYAITSVDRTGNESSKSAAVSVVVRIESP
jgi:hypothetical protein